LKFQNFLNWFKKKYFNPLEKKLQRKRKTQTNLTSKIYKDKKKSEN